MTKSSQADIIEIAQEIREKCESGFTGELSVTLKMNQGGIAHVSVFTKKDLRKAK